MLIIEYQKDSKFDYETRSVINRSKKLSFYHAAFLPVLFFVICKVKNITFQHYLWVVSVYKNDMPARAGVRALLKETHVTCISKENAAGVKNKSGRKNFSYRHAEKELSGIILHFQWEMRKKLRTTLLEIFSPVLSTSFGK